MNDDLQGSNLQDVHHYASFREMLEAEPLSKVLPGIKSTEEGDNNLFAFRGKKFM